MRRTLLLIAAAFAAGIGVGALLQPEGAPDRAGRPKALERAADHAAPPREDATLHAQLMALGAPDLPLGDGTIRGAVRDDDGSPLEGVLVVASLVTDGPERKARKGAPAPQDREIDDMVADLVRSERRQRESRRTARSGTDGAYEVTGLADAKWQLRAYKEGYGFQPRGNSAYNVEPGATVDFSGSSIVRIDVDVLMPDGTRPPRAQFRATSQRETRFESWLPEERWIELKPNVYELTAEVQFPACLKSQPQTVTVEPGKTPTVVFRLEGRPALSVKVAAPDGVRLPDWSVWAMRFTGDKSPDLALLRAEGLHGSGRGPHERGMVWQDIAAGSYLVGAAYSSNSPVVTSQVVQVGEGVTEVELRLPSPDLKDFVVVRVRDPDGAVPHGLRFLLGSGPGASGTPAVLERADGAFHLARDPQRESAGQSFWVAAESRTLGSVWRECAAGSTEEVVLAFERPGLVDLDIVGYAKSPHLGWLNFALAPRGQTAKVVHAMGLTKPSPEGACRLGPVQPGAYDLLVYSLVHVNCAWRATTIPLDVRSGEQKAIVNIPVLHAVTIRWPGQGQGRSITLHSEEASSGWISRQVTAEETTIERVPAGRYELRTFGGGNHAPIEFDVPAQTDITIR